LNPDSSSPNPILAPIFSEFPLSTETSSLDPIF
jgi:hypothetical protein